MSKFREMDIFQQMTSLFGKEMKYHTLILDTLYYTIQIFLT